MYKQPANFETVDSDLQVLGAIEEPIADSVHIHVYLTDTAGLRGKG